MTSVGWVSARWGRWVGGRKRGDQPGGVSCSSWRMRAGGARGGVGGCGERTPARGVGGLVEVGRWWRWVGTSLQAWLVRCNGWVQQWAGAWRAPSGPEAPADPHLTCALCAGGCLRPQTMTTRCQTSSTPSHWRWVGWPRTHRPQLEPSMAPCTCPAWCLPCEQWCAPTPVQPTPPSPRLAPPTPPNPALPCPAAGGGAPRDIPLRPRHGAGHLEGGAGGPPGLPLHQAPAQGGGAQGADQEQHPPPPRPHHPLARSGGLAGCGGSGRAAPPRAAISLAPAVAAFRQGLR